VIQKAFDMIRRAVDFTSTAEPALSMNDADDKKKPPSAEPAKDAPAKKTAMRLPAGVTPAGSKRPPSRTPWDNGTSGRPQKDAARRKGKSRKVH
jgi:hypothetical protein